MDVWMTKLQTPYDVALKTSKVEGMIFKDFRKCA